MAAAKFAPERDAMARVERQQEKLPDDVFVMRRAKASLKETVVESGYVGFFGGVTSY